MSDFETSLRERLHDAVPDALPPDGLAEGARRYARRAKRVRLGLTATVAAVALVLAGLALTSTLRPPPPVPATTVLAPADCRTGSVASTPAATPTSTAVPVAVWVCPASGTDTRTDGAPWVLPHVRIPVPAGRATHDELRLLAVDDSDADCTKQPHGPPFTVTVEMADGSRVTYRSEDLFCGGGGVLAQILGLLADVQLDARADAAPPSDPGCRSLERAERESAMNLVDVPPIATAYLCLAPEWNRPDEADHSTYLVDGMAPRSAVSVTLTAPQVAQLNAGLGEGVRFRRGGNGECLGEGAWRYSIQGVRTTGERFVLYTSCLDELWPGGVGIVDASHSRSAYIPTAATTALLRALVANVSE